MLDDLWSASLDLSREEHHGYDSLLLDQDDNTDWSVPRGAAVYMLLNQGPVPVSAMTQFLTLTFLPIMFLKSPS